MIQVCLVCGHEIHVTIYKGTGACSGPCFEVLHPNHSVTDRYVCDSCMRTVLFFQVADFTDGEHVICAWCSDPDDPRALRTENARLRKIIEDIADQVARTVLRLPPELTADLTAEQR